MISARQTKNVIEYMFGTSSGFIAPTATFSVAPNTYDVNSIPGGISLTGSITPNDGVVTGWSITLGATTLASGTGNSVSHSLVTIPSTIGSYVYNLAVSYTNNLGANLSIIVPTTVVVTAIGLFGQLATGVSIVVPADLTGGIEATLTSTSKATIINPFVVTAATVGRIIFTIPDSYGVVSYLEDGAGLDVLNQFDALYDAVNFRTIYTSINQLTPASYTYKFVF